MATADANRVLMAWAKETGFAEDPPNPAPTLQNIRFRSESLGQDTTTEISQEIRADRQIPDVFRTSIATSGDTVHELSYGTYDTELASALMADSAFSSEVVLLNAGSATWAASDQSISGTGIDTSATVGEWVFVEGGAASNNNGYFKIATKTSGKITLELGDAAITDEGPTSSVTVTMLSSITNGTTLDTYVIERQFQDLTTTFTYLLGQAINTMNWTVGVGDIVTMTLGWLGSKEKSATATIGDGSNTAASTTTAMNAVDNVIKIHEGSGATGDICAQNLTFTLNNNHRPKEKVGTLGAFEIGKGSIELSGTLQLYFNDKAQMDSYRNFTTSNIATRFKDASNNVYILDIPEIKYTGGRQVAGGINTDIIADMSWQAKRDATENVTIRIVKRNAP